MVLAHPRLQYPSLEQLALGRINTSAADARDRLSAEGRRDPSFLIYPENAMMGLEPDKVSDACIMHSCDRDVPTPVTGQRNEHWAYGAHCTH